ncbi:MAG: efflux RND transporter permease subunit, partial [Spirochaetales bacterium]|nr:efflux RND transporter permease subunit [Spirochaetales bacterium]
MSPRRFGAILYGQRRAILLVAAAAVITGIFSWTTMPRQEDPSLTARFGTILVIYPGGDADSIEELIVIPTEDQLRSVEEVAAVEVSIRPDVAAITVELDGRVRDVDPVWDEVESALRRAQREYPEGVEEPITNWDVTTVEAVIVGIGGSGDLNALWYAAEELEQDLRRVTGVKEVNIAPDIDRELVVTLDEATSRHLSMSRAYLAGQLAERLVTVPGGQLRVGTVQAGVDPESGVDTMRELGATEIVLPSGASIPLSSVGALYIGPAEPAAASARLDNRSVVTVGVVPQQAIDIVAFGEDVIATVDRFSAAHPELSVDYASFQPRRVETRLSDLAGSLLQGIAIVAAVVILAMGIRLGLTVAVMVPVVALGGLALYSVAGGVLHQISIAALVMSLGLLVDNAIVVAERIQWRLDAGEDRRSAAGAAVRELLVPLAAATGTTLAAYIPLLLARGETAEFTGAIPRLVMLTLTLSYFFAIIVTPTIAMMVLRPAAGEGEKRDGGTLTMAESMPAIRRVSHFSTRRPWVVIAGAVLGVGLVAALLPRVQQQFFPSSDRNQLVIDIETPRGTHIGETSRIVAILEQELLQRNEVVQVAAFAGRTAPRFYYNVLTVTNAPYRGQILVTTTTSDVVEAMTEWIRRRALEIVPEAVVVARKLEQGPPVDAPIQLRVAGEDFQRVAREVQNIIGSLQEIPGAVDVRSTLSAPTLTLSLAIDDARANALGITRASIAQAVRAAVRGVPAGEISYRDERIPVIVRSPAGEDYDAAQFDDIQLFSPVAGGLVPLAAVARVETEFRPSEITRRNGVRTASVLAELAPGAAYNEVLAALNTRLESPIDGVERTVGGAAEESAAA